MYIVIEQRKHPTTVIDATTVLDATIYETREAADEHVRALGPHTYATVMSSPVFDAPKVEVLDPFVGL